MSKLTLEDLAGGWIYALENEDPERAADYFGAFVIVVEDGVARIDEGKVWYKDRADDGPRATWTARHVSLSGAEVMIGFESTTTIKDERAPEATHGGVIICQVTQNELQGPFFDLYDRYGRGTGPFFAKRVAGEHSMEDLRDLSEAAFGPKSADD